MVGEKRDRDSTAIFEKESLFVEHKKIKVLENDLSSTAFAAWEVESEAAEAAGPFDQSDEQLDESMNSHEAARQWEEEDGSEVSCAGLDELDEDEGKEVSMDWVLGMEHPDASTQSEDDAAEDCSDLETSMSGTDADVQEEGDEVAQEVAAWEEEEEEEDAGSLSDADFESSEPQQAADLDRELTPELLAENSAVVNADRLQERETGPCDSEPVELEDETESHCPMAPPPLEDI
eukprot:CAMPEP_0184310574 /NCGR_PEP_ID=MMETSP1049-20130417/31151_1 /TAXON_ID=77928 /ORGANISM="Proteomonas sulcata, Strain CCMP704" /LENGTH=233 /DNA_ID=CAMNT_0026624899 /DNA_START=370 /DNA_END=1071 /DNA_ORIENTATION=+